MKIIDAFIFYNELDMLFYRLSALYNHVDVFVLVEATLTHKGQPKQLYYAENKEKYKRFEDKIVHIVVEELIPNAVHISGNRLDDEVWKNENYHRNCIDRGIQQLNLANEDLIMISDLDEIPNMNTIYEVITAVRDTTKIAIALEQDMYYYNLTSKQRSKWYSARVMSYMYYVSQTGSSPQMCRMTSSVGCVPNGGWHLSYFGGAAFIRNKLLNFAHQEFNSDKYTNIQTIADKIQTKTNLFDEVEFISMPISENTNLPPLCSEFFDLNGDLISQYKK
jgi:beta-1,4-mannosyl-glycoprotein beta-1,4-N-acetylglucosaminyltransferase